MPSFIEIYLQNFLSCPAQKHSARKTNTYVQTKNINVDINETVWNFQARRCCYLDINVSSTRVNEEFDHV